jgi:pimeloyl-ACP methyl ester carboxylesterase
LGVGDGEGDIARPVAAGRLGEIEKASLVIIGGEDQPGKFFTGDFLEKNMVQAEQAIIPGTAHLPPMEKPREFNQIVLDFLAK